MLRTDSLSPLPNDHAINYQLVVCFHLSSVDWKGKKQEALSKANDDDVIRDIHLIKSILYHDVSSMYFMNI